MKYTSKHKSLGLGKRDFNILKTIYTGPKRSFDISIESKIPRPTVLFLLKKMQNKLLVEKTGRRPNIVWEPTRVAKKILSEEKITDPPKEMSGVKNIEDAFVEFFLEAEDKKIYFIENTSHIKNVRMKFSQSYFKKIRSRGSRSKVIQEGLTTASSLPYLKEIKDISETKDKMISWTIVPDSYLTSEDSFFVLEDTVLIVNLQKETLLRVRNQSLADLVIEKINRLSKFGKKLGFSNFIKENSN